MNKVKIMCCICLLGFLGCSTIDKKQTIDDNIDTWINKYVKSAPYSKEREQIIDKLLTFEDIQDTLVYRISHVDDANKKWELLKLSWVLEERQTIANGEVYCGPRPVTCYGVRPREAIEKLLLECQKELSVDIQKDLLYYFVWGAHCDFGEECAERGARQSASWKMHGLLKEQYGNLANKLNYTTEEVYSKSASAGGGWYVSAVAIRVKKEDVKTQLEQ